LHQAAAVNTALDTINGRYQALVVLASDTARLALAIGYSAALLTLAARLAAPALARFARDHA
jgi:hypothetical protein